MKLPILAFFLWTLPLISAVNISGKAVNASRDSSAAAALVLLQKLGAGDAEPVTVASRFTNDGFFSFALSNWDTTATYFLAADYSGLRSYSPALDLSAGNIRTVVAVYDTTRSAGNLSVRMHHVIVEQADNVLQIRETRVFVNNGLLAVAAAPQHPLFTISLPKGADHFFPAPGQADDPAFSDGRVLVSGSLPPGQRSISFGYQIPKSSKRAALSIHITHPTQMFDLFAADGPLQFDSPVLIDVGNFMIRGSAYRRYHAEELGAGTVTVFYSERKAASPLPATALLAGLILGGGLLYGLLSERNHAAAGGPDDSRKKSH